MNLIEKLNTELPSILHTAPNLKEKSGQYEGPCPFCGGSDRFIIPKNGKERFFCRQCEKKGDKIDFHIKLEGAINIQELACARGITTQVQGNKRQKSKHRRKKGAWANAEANLENINKYFKRRELQFDDNFPLSMAIRFASWKDRDTGKTIRSILFAVTNLIDDKVMATQRIFIDSDYKKINRIMKGIIKDTGRGIWFHRKRRIEPKLLIGEGAETVLSVIKATGINGVSGMDTGKMCAVTLPDTVRELYILVDEDILKPGAKKGYAGQTASLKLAEQFETAREGNISYLISPSDSCFSDKATKQDFNDLLVSDPTGQSIRERMQKAQRLVDIKWQPPAGENTISKDKSAKDILAKFEVTRTYVDKLGNERFLYDDLIIAGHVVVIIALSGGGKTTFCFKEVVPKLVAQGLKIFYIDADSPASDHKMMLDQAEEIGFTLINPNVNLGSSTEKFIATLTDMSEAQVDLSDTVLFVDTLKKFADLMSKQDTKKFFSLCRNLTHTGATVVLMGHANKYRSPEGHLIPEGVNDVKADTDELIFLEREIRPDGGIDVTSVIDIDKGAKVRGIFKPFSFHITPDREVQLYAKPIELVDHTSTKTTKAFDEEILEIAEQYLASRGEPVKQNQLAEFTSDKVTGEAGLKRVKKLIVQHSVMKGDNEPFGTRFLYTIGQRNSHMYELPAKEPLQESLWLEDE